MNKREKAAELVGDDLLFADGLDEALIGIVTRFGMEPVALYDRDKVIEIFMKEGLNLEEAEEHFGFNVFGAWVGEKTPAYAVLFS